MSFPAMHPALVAMTLALWSASPSAVHLPGQAASHQESFRAGVAWGSSDPGSGGPSSFGQGVLAFEHGNAVASAGSEGIETKTNAFVRIVERHPLNALATHVGDTCRQAIASNLPSGGEHAGAWRALAGNEPVPAGAARVCAGLEDVHERPARAPHFVLF